MNQKAFLTAALKNTRHIAFAFGHSPLALTKGRPDA